MPDKTEFSEDAHMIAWLRNLWKFGPASHAKRPNINNETDIVRLPPHLYMRRKTFELGTDTLRRVDDRVGPHLATAGTANDPQIEELNVYWAREHALYETFCSSDNYTYEHFLPGRAYTYRCLAEIVTSLQVDSNVSVLDVGCGSALLSRFLNCSGRQYVGADVSMTALHFARRIASDGGIRFAPVLAAGKKLPFRSGSFGLSVSLGLLEHFDIPAQHELVEEAARVTGSYIVIAVPNTNSPIFRAMCSIEASMAGAMGFPLEAHYYDVDFSKIAEYHGLKLQEQGAFHIPTPAYLDRFAAAEEIAFFQGVVKAADDAYCGSASDAWWSVERCLSKSERNKFGWFSYGIFAK